MDSTSSPHRKGPAFVVYTCSPLSLTVFWCKLLPKRFNFQKPTKSHIRQFFIDHFSCAQHLTPLEVGVFKEKSSVWHYLSCHKSSACPQATLGSAPQMFRLGLRAAVPHSSLRTYKGLPVLEWPYIFVWQWLGFFPSLCGHAVLFNWKQSLEKGFQSSLIFLHHLRFGGLFRSSASIVSLSPPIRVVLFFCSIELFSRQFQIHFQVSSNPHRLMVAQFMLLQCKFRFAQTPHTT